MFDFINHVDYNCNRVHSCDQHGHGPNSNENLGPATLQSVGFITG